MHTQNAELLAAFRRGIRLTPAEAFYEIGTMKLSSRVGELRRDGHAVLDRWKTITLRSGRTTRVKEYWMDA